MQVGDVGRERHADARELLAEAPAEGHERRRVAPPEAEVRVAQPRDVDLAEDALGEGLVRAEARRAEDAPLLDDARLLVLVLLDEARDRIAVVLREERDVEVFRFGDGHGGWRALAMSRSRCQRDPRASRRFAPRCDHLAPRHGRSRHAG